MMLFPDNWFGKIVPLIDDRGFTIVGSISQMHRIPANQDMNKLILYNWDVYPWIDIIKGDWFRWGELMKSCLDIWHASEVCKLRTKEIYGIDKGIVIKTFVPVDWVQGETGDERYVLMPIRHYLKDECFYWADRVCKELGIRLIRPNRAFSAGVYAEVMRKCTLILSPYAEASTGGLGMIEGYSLGKLVLANSSKYNGAKEYMGNQAVYFSSYEDMKDQIKKLFFETSKVDLESNQEWIRKNYAINVMAEKINAKLEDLCAQNKS